MKIYANTPLSASDRYEFFDYEELGGQDGLDGFHLPLDWNEEMSLEDYLADLERRGH